MISPLGEIPAGAKMYRLQTFKKVEHLKNLLAILMSLSGGIEN